MINGKYICQLTSFSASGDAVDAAAAADQVWRCTQHIFGSRRRGDTSCRRVEFQHTRHRDDGGCDCRRRRCFWLLHRAEAALPTTAARWCRSRACARRVFTYQKSITMSEVFSHKIKIKNKSFFTCTLLRRRRWWLRRRRRLGLRLRLRLWWLADGSYATTTLAVALIRHRREVVDFADIQVRDLYHHNLKAFKN